MLDYAKTKFSIHNFFRIHGLTENLICDRFTLHNIRVYTKQNLYSINI